MSCEMHGQNWLRPDSDLTIAYLPWAMALEEFLHIFWRQNFAPAVGGHWRFVPQREAL